MTAEHVIAFNIALIAALISPGPALMVSIRASLSGGLRSGVLTGLGLATMAAIWTASALAGLEGVFLVFPWAYTAFKVAGALYLIFIAVKAWRGAHDPVSAAPDSSGRAFANGVLVNLANPKSILFAAAVLVVIFPPDLGLWAKGLIVANHFAVEVIAYSLLSIALTREPVRDRYLRAKPVLDRISAVILGALGVRLLLDRT